MQITNAAYINMDHRIDKNLFMIQQISFSPKYLNVQRFSGENINDYINYPVHDYIRYGSQHHKGVIGCWQSHKKIIDHYRSLPQLDSNAWTLILEDDISINSFFWFYLDKLQPPEDGDMIFFDSAKQDIDPKYIINADEKLSLIYTSWPIFIGTHCYAIRNSSLDKIYEILNGVSIYKDIDGYYFVHPNIIKYNYQSNLIKINYQFSSDRLTPIPG